MKKHLIPLLLATWALALSSNAAADNTPLSASQESLLKKAAQAFAQGHYLPAAAAFPALENTYMGAWVGYWSLQPRLNTLTQKQYLQYSARFPDGVAHHLLRRQWLIQLAHRQDWNAFTTVYQSGTKPDLIQLRCDAFRDPALHNEAVVSPYFLWSSAPANDHSCNAMARDSLQQGLISQKQLWQHLQQMFAASAFTAARQFAPYLNGSAGAQLASIIDHPDHWIQAQIQHYGSGSWPVTPTRLLELALLRLAASQPDQAVAYVAQLQTLNAAQKARVLYQAAFQSTQSFRPESGQWYQLAYATDPQFHPRPEVLAWMIRTAIRDGRWAMVSSALSLMDAAQRHERQWQFWNAVAHLKLGQPSLAKGEFATLASPWTYYGQLAMAALGQSLSLHPPSPGLESVALPDLQENDSERAAITLYRLGLYYDALREWDHDLKTLSDPAQIKAAARMAFQQQAWLLGIHASSLIPDGGDWRQGYILPYAEDISAAAMRTGLRRAFLAGLIRQESGFAFGIRSDVGAQGLMQVMPSTAAWLQSHIPAAANADLHSIWGNLVLGSNYLSLQQQRFDGSELLAAAAYNAGPGAPKRWLGRWTGPTQGPWAGPIFTANIPYQQTRNYVQNVLTNTVIYAAVLDHHAQDIWPHWQLEPAQH
ncbi:transglycosylase SLT domain-containing protein [Acidithiobacillus sp. M4-SHS-6]|uniref:lytic transglycosylase domain-containing protein n=1 Tax=Acidithiobacillus sp. M4-SHS-6 TaxID=3383024 RepID=UPI0039BE0594